MKKGEENEERKEDQGVLKHHHLKEEGIFLSISILG
jgi:hypothetical protein